jgi:hypothetical protein
MNLGFFNRRVFRWIIKFGKGIMELIKERSDFPNSVLQLIIPVRLIHIVTKYRNMSTGYKKILFHDVTVKWCMELLKGGPVVFYCVPYIVSSSY